jgi:hypothetical protein
MGQAWTLLLVVHGGRGDLVDAKPEGPGTKHDAHDRDGFTALVAHSDLKDVRPIANFNDHVQATLATLPDLSEDKAGYSYGRTY